MESANIGQVCPKGLLREYQRKLQKWPTPAEKRFKFILTRFCQTLGKPYGFQSYFHNRQGCRHYFVDFCVPFYRAVFEIDGYSHDNPIQKEDDRIRDAYLNKIGFHVYRVSNLDTKRTPFCEQLIWKAIDAGTQASERRAQFKASRELEERLQKEWLAKREEKKAKRRRKKTGIKKPSLRRQINEQLSQHAPGMAAQSDPQKAYEQCMRYLNGPPPPSQEMRTALNRKKHVRQRGGICKCPNCQKGVMVYQPECPYCHYVREIKGKYRTEALPVQGAINRNLNTPAVRLRKKLVDV